VWSQRATSQTSAGWDVFGRSFAADASSSADAVRINGFPTGDQFGPKICAAGANQLVVWTSLGQDGCRDGIFGKMFSGDLSNGQDVGRGSPLLAADDIVSAATLVRALTEAAVAGGQFFWNQFPTASKQALTDPSVSVAQKQLLLATEFNLILQSGPLYDADRFAGLVLSPETAYLLTQNPQGDELLRLNRLVLQDVLWLGLNAQNQFTRLPPCSLPQLIEKLKLSINTTTISRQMEPAIACDSVGRFLVAWTSFVADTGFDLYAQRYAAGQLLPQPSAPFVSALSQTSLGVSWPLLSGFPVSSYEVYQDGSASVTATTTNNMWLAAGFAPGSTHWFQLAFVLGNGRRSPLSAPATNKTWGADLLGHYGNVPDGLPDDWQALYFGSKTSNWDGPNVDSDGDGASNWQEFLAGTNPRDPNSVLKSFINGSPQGRRLSWNTVAGCVYQVEASNDFVTWSNVGAPRFAAGTSDSILLPAGQSAGYYRVVRVQ